MELETFHCSHCISDSSFTPITIHFDFDLNCLEKIQNKQHIVLLIKIKLAIGMELQSFIRKKIKYP